MSGVNGRHNGRRIVLPVAVLSAQNPTDLTLVRASALLDTGATVSGIGPRLISELGLLSHQKRRLISATNISFVDYYLFRIGLFENEGGQTNGLPYIFDGLDGFGWGHEGDFEVILGMDVLGRCDFSVSKSGNWQLNFG